MGIAGKVITSMRTNWGDRRDERRRRDLIERIGELTYAQRTDPSAAYGAEIERLVEEVRHLERMNELRHRERLADPD